MDELIQPSRSIARPFSQIAVQVGRHSNAQGFARERFVGFFRVAGVSFSSINPRSTDLSVLQSV
jgi:hypothetical protein